MYVVVYWDTQRQYQNTQTAVAGRILDLRIIAIVNLLKSQHE